MPEHYLRYKDTPGWDAGYFLSLASKTGECSVDVFKKVLASREYIEQTYLSCKGLKRLSGGKRTECDSSKPIIRYKVRKLISICS
jgi:hypothetical protein